MKIAVITCTDFLSFRRFEELLLVFKETENEPSLYHTLLRYTWTR
jgi:hypothetical protein